MNISTIYTDMIMREEPLGRLVSSIKAQIVHVSQEVYVLRTYTVATSGSEANLGQWLINHRTEVSRIKKFHFNTSIDCRKSLI